jgi:hypothetical protein
MADPNEILFSLEQTEILDDAAVGQTLEAALAQPAGKLKKLQDEAKKRGYREVKGAGGKAAVRDRVKSNKPVKPPAGQTGAPVSEVTFEMALQALDKPNSQDQAAIALVTITADNGDTQQYEMLLEAPGGDFAKARESMVERDQVVAANSWWTAARSCVLSRCTSVCIGALVTCTGTWAAYLLCLATRCGVCWARCAGCASCDCSWWCRWATGCCDA